MKYYLLRNKEDWIVRYGIREEWTGGNKKEDNR